MTHKRVMRDNSQDGSAMKRPETWLKKIKQASGFMPNPDKIAGIIDASKGLRGGPAGALLLPDASMNTLGSVPSKATLRGRHHSVTNGAS